MTSITPLQSKPSTPFTIAELASVRQVYQDITGASFVLFRVGFQYDDAGVPDGELQRAITLVRERSSEIAALHRRLSEVMVPATDDDIAMHLDIVVRSFPNAARTDLTVFGDMLVQFVRDEAPTKIALQTACWTLIRTSKFLPTIAEVVEAVAVAKKEMASIVARFAELPNRLAKASDALTYRQEQQGRRRTALPRIAASTTEAAG